MNGRTFFGFLLFCLVLFINACGTPAAVPLTAAPMPPTNTPISPTYTAVPPTPTSEPTATPIPPTKVPSFSEMVDVGGYKLYLRCVGEGSPTVVLDSDASNDMYAWSHVLEEKPTDMGIRVCHYNRAGLGLDKHSDMAPNKPRTNTDMAEDLFRLLTNAQIDGPYIMVGHLMGGWNVRLFRDLHPDDVVGMVLVDGGHPDTFTRALDLIPPETEDEAVTQTAFRNYYIRLLEEPLKAPEYLDVKKSTLQLRAVSPLGDLPLVVLSHDTVDRTAQYDYLREIYIRYGAEFPVDLFNKIEDDWVLQMEELAALSTNSTYIIVEGSSFWLPTSQPESVVNAIRIVLEAVRGE